MAVIRKKEWPRPMGTIQDPVVSEYIDLLNKALKEESSTRTTDFDWKKFINVPWTDVRTFGATGSGTGDDTVSLRTALSHLSASGGGWLFVPPGTYNITPGIQDGDGTAWHGLTMYSNIRIIGVGNPVFKLSNNWTSVGSPKQCILLGSDQNIENVIIENIEFDLNEANNKTVWPLRTASIGFSTNGGYGTDIMISKCRFLNSAGGNTIVMALGTPLIRGSNWIIDKCYFENNGTSTHDYSAIWGWANNVRITNNRFYEVTMDNAYYSNIKTAAELHGYSSIFSGNIVENYSIGLWVAQNLTGPVSQLIVNENTISPVRIYGIAMYNEDVSPSSLGDVIVTNNSIKFNDVDPGHAQLIDGGAAYEAVGIKVNTQLSLDNLLITGNSVTRPTGSAYMTRGVMVACGRSGETYESIDIDNNTLRGLSNGIKLLSGFGGGQTVSASVTNNKISDLRGTGAEGIHCDFDASLPGEDINITGNTIRNHEGVNTNKGIYLVGSFGTLTVDGNHFYNMGGGNVVASVSANKVRGRQAYYSDLSFDDGDVLVTGISTSEMGVIYVKAASVTAIYRVDVSGTLTVISAHATFYSTDPAKDHASTINCYFEGGVFKVQNKTGVLINCYVRMEEA